MKKYEKPTIELVEVEDVVLTSVTVVEWDGQTGDSIKF